jgi:hypothetical protein
MPSVTTNANGWPDVWRIYEDVCVICAGLWFGSWRRNSLSSYSTLDGADAHRSQWGAARAPGDVDLSLPSGSSIREVGAGIENRPPPSPSNAGAGIEYRAPPQHRHRRRRDRRVSGTSTLIERQNESGDDYSDSSSSSVDLTKDAMERRASQVRTTRALLQTFHAHTRFQLDTLAGFLPTDLAGRYTDAETYTAVPTEDTNDQNLLTLYPKDVLAFELGPFSALDARYVEWLGDEYGGGIRIVVKRGWRDLFGLVLGLV